METFSCITSWTWPSSLSLDEWNNFLERVKCYSEEEIKESVDLEEELRLWASYRGQTLTRTGILFWQFAFQWNKIRWIHYIFCFFVNLLIMFAVRGMMYYRKALELQAFLDMAMHEGVLSLILYSTTACWCSTHSEICFYRFDGRLQGCRTKLRGHFKRGKIIVGTVPSCCWHEVYICCFMSTVWYS